MERIPTEGNTLVAMAANEQRLRQLLLQGLAGEAQPYHVFLKDLGSHIRAFLRRRLASLPDEIEDLVQDTLLAVHNQRHTYQIGRASCRERVLMPV